MKQKKSFISILISKTEMKKKIWIMTCFSNFELKSNMEKADNERSYTILVFFSFDASGMTWKCLQCQSMVKKSKKGTVMECYVVVLLLGSKLVSLQQEDMITEKISIIFQVCIFLLFPPF